MSLRVSHLLLFLGLLLSGYITLSKMGGVLVFGFGNCLELCLIIVPVLAFPVQLLALWNVRLSLIGFFFLILIYLGAHLYIGNRSVRLIKESGAHIELYLMNLALIFLLWVSKLPPFLSRK
jgi:hypothetical protein